MPKIEIPPVNPAALFRKTEYISDAGAIITELMPVVVSADGRVVDDPVRQPTYQGLCFAGGQPIQFKLDSCKNLFEACEQFVPGIQKVAEEVESQQLRQRMLSAAANQPGRPPRAPR